MAERRITQDVIVLAVSILFAVFLVKSGAIHALVQAGGNIYWTSFIAGLFFTTVVTTAPSIAILGSLAQEGNILMVSLVGAAGAVLGDYVLFMFVRHRISSDINHLLSKRTAGRLRALLRQRTFKWLTPFVAGLLIAIPLPTDELGISLLGMTKLPTKLFMPLVFTFNFMGIYLICLAGRALGA